MPGFKPASADEIARRFRNVNPDVTSKFYAIEDDEVVGYAVFNSDGRISYPWCLPEAQDACRHLLEAVLLAMSERGCPEAWLAYRADWSPVLDFFREHRFTPLREMVNYISELVPLPRAPIPEGQVIAPLVREELPQLLALGKGLIAEDDPDALAEFFWENPFFPAESLYALESPDGGKLRARRWSSATLVTPTRPRSTPRCPASAWVRWGPSATGTNGSTACSPACSRTKRRPRPCSPRPSAVWSMLG